jgi:hypothetical protein
MDLGTETLYVQIFDAQICDPIVWVVKDYALSLHVLWIWELYFYITQVNWKIYPVH